MMCVECGKDAPGLIDGACAECFTSHNKLLTIPDVVQVEICAHCGARHEGAHWYDVPEGELERWTLEDTIRGAAGIHREVESPDLEIEMEQKDNKTFAITVHLEGHVQDVEVEETHKGLLRRTQGSCNRCSRIHGGYWAAIIQLRASERDMTEPELALAHKLVAQDLDRQIGSGNRFAFLAKSAPMHGGFDYYVGDIDAGRNVAKRLRTRLGGSIHESAKLVGRKEGEDVYRVTFLMRMATFSPGDILLRDGHPFQVMQVHQKVINAFDLERQLRGRISPDGLRRVGGIELLKEAIVVSRGPDGLMVLDPDTHKTETILVPDNADIGETVPVVRIDERLYWVPSDGRSTNNP